MKLKLTSVMVEDQEHALKFYTEVLGFQVKNDIPMGDFRFLTVVSPDGHQDVELLLEPNANRAAATFQKAMFEQDIPLNAFWVADVQAEFERLKELGVVFKAEPVDAGTETVALFDDTCGNLIQIYNDGT